MYGFKKVKKGIAKNSFYHPYFQKNVREEMKLIRRRKNCRSTNEENIHPGECQIELLGKKAGGSEDTIVATPQQQQVQCVSDQSIKIQEQLSRDVMHEFVPDYHDMSHWGYLNEDVFHYEDSFEYPLLHHG